MGSPVGTETCSEVTSLNGGAAVAFMGPTDGACTQTPAPRRTCSNYKAFDQTSVIWNAYARFTSNNFSDRKAVAVRGAICRSRAETLVLRERAS